jgi:O-methyltransferase/methyltransferase family protein
MQAKEKGMNVPPSAALMQMVIGYRASQALYVAAKLGIADLLKDGPKGSDALAQATQAHPAALRRLLRALVSLGVFEEDAQGRFGLTPMGTHLRSDVPGSLRAPVLFLAGEEGWRSWGALLHSVQTGEPAFDHVYGMGGFDYYAEHPEGAKILDEAMAGFTALVADAVLGAYDFSGTRTLVDVGGGNGALLAAILKAHPTMRGILFDLPHVVSGAPQVLGDAGVVARCQVVGGSFFESVPEGGDAYLLKWIIHDWDDERSVAILTACRRAMKGNGKLLVVDQVLPHRAEPSESTDAFMFDLEMLVVTSGGRERSEDEFRTLLAAAGFRLNRVVATTWVRLGVIEGLVA